MTNNHIKTRIIFIGWVVFGILMVHHSGNIDGNLYPVVKAEITEISNNTARNGWVLVSGTYSRIREGCTPLRVEWYSGTRGERNVVLDLDWNASISETDGTFLFKHWDIQADHANLLEGKTFANVVHQCTLMGIDLPWETKTHFYN